MLTEEANDDASAAVGVALRHALTQHTDASLESERTSDRGDIPRDGRRSTRNTQRPSRWSNVHWQRPMALALCLMLHLGLALYLFLPQAAHQPLRVPAYTELQLDLNALEYPSAPVPPTRPVAVAPAALPVAAVPRAARPSPHKPVNTALEAQPALVRSPAAAELTPVSITVAPAPVPPAPVIAAPPAVSTAASPIASSAALEQVVQHVPLSRRQQAQAQRAQRSYIAQLIARLQEQRFYPAQARKDKASGVVKLRFTVDAQGQVHGAQLASSAGHAALDAAALEVLRLASPFPPIPPAMRRASLTITVPIDFALTTE